MIPSVEVNGFMSPDAFMIDGTDDTTVEELLIVHNLDAAALEKGLTPPQSPMRAPNEEQ